MISITEISSILAAQRRSFLDEGHVSVEVRRERLNRLARAILGHEAELVSAFQVDYANRSPFITRAFDILGTVAAIEYHFAHFEDWMKPETVVLPTNGITAEVHFQPLGVLGAIIPWNGPVLMGCLAAMGGISAGNRVMLKMSELAPATGIAFAAAIEAEFDATEVAVINGDASVAAEFSKQPFDHLLFTGSTATGRKVAEAAAKNLVPVTLELGGKSPVVVGKSADLSLVANRLVAGKLSSAGQVCVAPDYVLVPTGSGSALARECIRAANTLFPQMMRTPDYTSLIDHRAAARMQTLLRDSADKGADLAFAPPEFSLDHLPDEGRFPFVVLQNVTDKMKLLQEEIFGPLLPIIEYETLDQALAMIERWAHPLSAYYFGEDEAEADKVAASIQTGSFVINDVRIQLAFEELPFGGVGPSGQGRYRGKAGFISFSNRKTILRQHAQEAELARTRPPYGPPEYEHVMASIDHKKAQYGVISPNVES